MEEVKTEEVKKKRSRNVDKKKQQGYTSKYVSTHYEKISVLVPQGFRDKIRAAAYDRGISLNEFMVTAACAEAGIEPPEKHPIVEMTYSNQ